MQNDTPNPVQPGEKSKTGMWVSIAIVLLLLIVAFFVFGRDAGSPEDALIPEDESEINLDAMDEEMEMEMETMPDTSLPSAVDVTTDTTTAVESDANVKTFEISGTNFEFSQEEIRVNQGDTVRIVFTSEEGLHDWVVDEFNAATDQVQAGGTSTVEFVADQAGTFEYYCSVMQHRAQGMVGNLIVE